jgi:formate C-acetyltransferase
MSQPHNGQLLVFDVQRFCVHDGPGIRSVVFLKGCPLRCRWCQNPESLLPQPEIAFYADRCLGCMECAAACPNQAIMTGATRVDRSLCQTCGACAEACPHVALRRVGWQVSPQDLHRQVLADRAYFDASGGGVTLSGGEPLLQPDAAAELLSLCHDSGLTTTVETSGAVPWESLDQVRPHVDLFYYDLKAGGETWHRELTGSGQDRIIDNAERLIDSGADVQLRMPVVPGLNDSDDSLNGVARHLERLGRPAIRLLRYHRGGEAKISRIDSRQPALGYDSRSSEEALEQAAEKLSCAGINVTIEGEGRPEIERNSFSDRVWRLRSAVNSCQPAVCAERAMLVTSYFKERRNRRKPVVVQKGEALRRVLGRRQTTIYDDELLVGCYSSKRVGGSVLPELHGVAMMEDLLAFGSRQINPLKIGAAERRTLGLKVMPFWLTRFLTIKAFPLPKALRFIKDQLTAKRYLINESGGISHLIPDYAKLLRLGTSGIAAEARTRAETTDDSSAKNFYTGVEQVCRGLEEMAAGFVETARRQAAAEADEQRRHELEQIATVCERVPRQPATTFQEALQSLLFAQIAINQESLDNSVCPGRLDQILYPYFIADLETGRIDEQGARDLIGCFTVKMSEVVPVFSRRITRFHGGMFNGATVVVGGTDRQGRDACNRLTWLFLDAMDELRMRQPNYHARLHSGSPASYVERIAGMLRNGSGAPSLMNDEVVVPMMVGHGIKLEDARDYSPAGCIEPVVCAASFASTDAALFNLALCLERALGTKRGGAGHGSVNGCTDIDEVIVRFRVEVDHLVDELIADLQAIERANASFHPTPLTSMLLQGCLESGVDSTAGGATYNSSGIQGVGVADIADSLAAIDHVVLQRRDTDMETLLTALKDDFKGHEALRGRLLRASKFGNDDPVADGYADQVIGIFADSLARYTNTRGGRYLAGFYSVTAHVAFGETTGALPSGRLAGRPLANGLSPAGGADRLGPTAALGSVANLDLVQRARNGINVNLKLDQSLLAGGSGRTALAGLVQGYFNRGGMQVQMNIIDPDLLEEARDHPERHPNLLVRVSGYSAYFNDLSPAMKQEIIDRCSCRS